MACAATFFAFRLQKAEKESPFSKPVTCVAANLAGFITFLTLDFAVVTVAGDAPFAVTESAF